MTTLIELFAAATTILLVLGAILLLFSILILVCQYRVYMKLGMHGWEAIIPLYRLYALAHAVGQGVFGYISMACAGVTALLNLLDIEALAVLVTIATVLGMVMNIVVLVFVLDELCRPKWMVVLAVLLPFVFWPLLAFTDRVSIG